MKKLFFILFILPVLFSCSSDDEKYDINDASIILGVDDIHPTTHEILYGYFYTPEKITLLFVGEKKGIRTYAVDGICPVHIGTKNTIQYNYTMNESSNQPENLHALCTNCKAEFDINSGKAKNDNAKGKNIGVYKTKTEIDDSGYGWTKVYIWK